MPQITRFRYIFLVYTLLTCRMRDFSRVRVWQVLVGNHERAIFASTGSRKRELATYTKQIKQYSDKENAKRRCESDRYHLLNLTHLAQGKNRIEFRAFAGTLN